ncbi:leishmanolysin-related zinc metalloendopeptidase [Larkinella sp. GY13]|uniref:leishmanolysin-related zinc metalloendopeptidase n=1 Tax=Larkinella sp. GY13 TaxID=3453720 RepID=UPI003EEAE74F
MKKQKATVIESYFAKADVNLAQALANSTSPFTIEVRFLGGLTENQKNAFKAAADRWSSVIVGDLPTIKVDGENIDDVLILAEGSDIDGSGGILGQAGPTHLRPANAGVAAFLPAKGRMTFDKADLENMENNGSLTHVITHEMGHVLGIGTIWTRKGLLKGAGTTNPTFTGTLAMFEYGQLKGTGPAPVPVENQHGPGTQDSHWREPIFRNELMTGFIDMGNNPLSRVTVGSLKDMGYVVDMNAAEAYTLPNLLQLAESGELISAEDSLELGTMLSIIPTVLPEDSLQ